MTTLTALAKELSLNKSTVSRYAQRGMPVGDRVAALQWIARNATSSKGGWTSREGKNTAATASQALAKRQPHPGGLALSRESYEALRSRFERLPAFVAGLEPQAPGWFVLAVTDIVDLIVGAAVFAVEPGLIDDRQRPLSEPDIAALAASRGVTVAEVRQWRDVADRFIDSLADRLPAEQVR